VEETSTGAAPWQIVESTEARYRNLRVAEAALKALEERLERDDRAEGKVRPKGRRPVRKRARTILDTVDLNKKPLPHGKYRSQLDRHQAQLSRLTRKAHEKGVSSVLVFEGWDAAGKGGVIRRITAAMNPENYHVIPVAAPTEEEKAHHYLWRFWRREPRVGEVTIFDRSWYGRVLVERVEGFASESEWQRAYSEINDFEAQLHGHGVLVLKFWLHIDRDEQLRRFRARQQTEYKKYKITDEDFRNREQWDHYTCAVDDMVARTGTDYAPWHLVGSNDKRRARVEVLRIYSKVLKQRL
jgi:polyphosphate kinase 2 (PPK2 family)